MFSDLVIHDSRPTKARYHNESAITNELNIKTIIYYVLETSINHGS